MKCNPNRMRKSRKKKLSKTKLKEKNGLMSKIEKNEIQGTEDEYIHNKHCYE